jgi:hypothetical protein
VHPKVRQIAEAKAQLVHLEATTTQERAGLHDDSGFDSVQRFVAAGPDDTGSLP